MIAQGILRRELPRLETEFPNLKIDHQPEEKKWADQFRKDKTVQRV